MTQLLISIKTLSPLYVGVLKPYGSFLETHAEIPGSILRGAVAQRTLPDCVAPELINNHEACIVKEICPFYYLTTVVAFPTCAVAEGRYRAELPLRMMVTCKAAPDFASQSTTREPKHGVFDTLLRHFAFICTLLILLLYRPGYERDGGNRCRTGINRNLSNFTVQRTAQQSRAAADVGRSGGLRAALPQASALE